MYRLFVIALILICLNDFIKCEDRSYNGLPPIFYIDDYEQCKADKKIFCKVSVILRKGDSNTSYYWDLIEDSIRDPAAYNHNELFHAACINDFCPGHSFDNVINSQDLSHCYAEKYKDLGVTADILHFNCSNHDNIYKAGVFDYVWLIIIIAYVFLVLLTSYWDYQQRHKSVNQNIITAEFDQKYLKPFSLLSNIEKLKNQNKNQEFQRLKFIQGIRFYNMLLIILCHTFASYIGGYVLNTEYFESIDESPIKLGLRNLMVFLVQTFFLLSAFFLSYHMFQIIDSRNKFNKKIILLSFFNRYLRILPPVVVMIGFGTSMWIVDFFYGPVKDLYSDLEYRLCRKNWWTTLLFINNHYNQKDMCYFITWYLAADTQLYVLSLIIISIIWIFPKSRTKILGWWLIISIFIPIIVSYIHNLDIIFRITPENAKNNQFRSFKFSAIYSSTHPNMATYAIGLCMGYIYLKYSNNNLFRSWVYKILWLTAFIGLPVIVLMLSSYYFSRLSSAIICGILKPLYAVGIAVGIFGMSQKTGGIIKKICEWKPAVFLGNFTYSTYLVHYVVVFYRTATATKPYYVSDYILITSFICDAVLSFCLGFVMHILVELPMLQIQNALIPQVRKDRISNSDKTKK